MRGLLRKEAALLGGKACLMVGNGRFGRAMS